MPLMDMNLGVGVVYAIITEMNNSYLIANIFVLHLKTVCLPNQYTKEKVMNASHVMHICYNCRDALSP